MSWDFNTKWTRMAVFGGALTALSACDESGKFAMPQFAKPNEAVATAETPAPSNSTELVERDVEAPEVFQVTEDGLWDGRPSLGGVWVAHPDVTDPERVIIRNTANGKFVIGALFRRERDIPGPRLQISSDAAAALGMLAGAPSNLNVTALRREEVAEPVAAPAPPIPAETSVDAPAPVAQTGLDPVATAAANAINNADPAATPTETAAAPAAPAPVPASVAQPVSKLPKPFIQIGIFSVEKNAERTANVMRSAGVVPTVKKQTANGKPFWRVIVGPAQTNSERAALLKKIKAEGFSDAYAVTN